MSVRVYACIVCFSPTHLVRPDLPPDLGLLEDVHGLARQRHRQPANLPVRVCARACEIPFSVGNGNAVGITKEADAYRGQASILHVP